MIIQPELLRHPDYLQLKAMVGPGALECLISLWAHCQAVKRDEFWSAVGRDYVEVVAGWSGPKGRLAKALVHTHWLEITSEGVKLVHWNKHNAGLRSSQQNGCKGGRPRGRNPQDNPPTTGGLPKDSPQDNPPTTGGLVNCNLPVCGLDRIGEEGSASRARAVSLSPKTTDPDPVVPTEAEVVEFGRGAPGIPEEYCHEYWQKKQEAPAMWFDARGNLIQWQRQVVRFWTKDRQSWGKKTGLGGARIDRQAWEARRDDLRCRLQLAKTPAEARPLREELERMEAT